VPDFAEQRTIPLEESSAGVARYTTAPGEIIRVESVTFETSWEPPVIVQGQVFYGAPAAGTIGYYSTPWIIQDPAAVSTFGFFTFARGLTSVPDDAPRIASPYALPDAIVENQYFMVPLPDLALGDGWELGVVLSGVDTAGAAVDLHIVNCVVTVTDLRDEPGLESGVPPYTAQPLDAQFGPVAA
jgi:hypothetical protein